MEPGQRAAEVVGDIVGHLAQFAHQHLDARQHPVDARREVVELVAAPRHRNPAGQVAVFHDPAAGLVHRLCPPAQVAGDQNARRKPRQHDQPAGRSAENDDPAGKRDFLADIVSDQKPEPVGEVGDIGAGGVPVRRFAVMHAAIVEIVPVAGLLRRLRPCSKIARDLAPPPIYQEVKRRALETRPPVDNSAQQPGPQRPVMLRQSLQFRFDDLPALLLQRFQGRAVEKTEADETEDPQHGQIDQRQPEGRGAQQVSRPQGGIQRP